MADPELTAAMPVPALAAAPIDQSRRIETLDVTRGFALLGILAMNIRMFAGPFESYMNPYVMYDYSGLNRAAFWFTTVVFDTKMMTLFSMLFGAGVVVWAGKRTQAGRPARGLWFRRMFWLFIIGMIHAYIIWEGDILVTYALCGMILPWWLRRLPPKWLLAIGLALVLIGGALSGMWYLGVKFSPPEEQAKMLSMFSPTPERLQEHIDAHLGPYWDLVVHRAPDTIKFQTMFFLIWGLWRAGGNMLIGAALFKFGVLSGARSTRFYVVLAFLTLPVGLAMGAMHMLAGEACGFRAPTFILTGLWNYFGSLFAAVGYAALICLIVRTGVLATLTSALASVGQMAFTNYLMQSILVGWFFNAYSGVGLGYYARLDYFGQLAVVFALWGLQLAASPWWLSRYRFGPAEWLWRSLTYWSPQSMRR